MDVPLADAQLEAFLDAFNATPAPPAASVGAATLRAGAHERALARPPGPRMAGVHDLAVPGGPAARLYRPTGSEAGLVVWFHGGGWVVGDLETHDRACRRLAARSGLAVLAVAYRLAPEHPWPAAVDDAVTAVRWVRSHPEVLGAAPSRLAVAGDSAGGTLATLACLRLRTEDPAAVPDAQVLVYANTDLAASGGSLASEGHGYGLDREGIEWFYDQYVPDRTLRTDRRVSPLREPDLTGLPATVVVTCEHDPLRDQGEAYARRLEEAGTPVTLRREAGMVHNFLLWDLASPACAAAGDRVADDLRRLLAQA
ncbi:alpha/beta hydrolase [Kineosporia sp. A_224]|uniref:alpha/beta hydrolase n=1 Tax=Kineosporia sp. A_224 TaxID=1962180 RepID=UPI000B4A9EAF|nr:alpha/beta hydrolase [Kineosporia sp. A_224]